MRKDRSGNWQMEQRDYRKVPQESGISQYMKPKFFAIGAGIVAVLLILLIFFRPTQSVSVALCSNNGASTAQMEVQDTVHTLTTKGLGKASLLCYVPNSRSVLQNLINLDKHMTVRYEGTLTPASLGTPVHGTGIPKGDVLVQMKLKGSFQECIITSSKKHCRPAPLTTGDPVNEVLLFHSTTGWFVVPTLPASLIKN